MEISPPIELVKTTLPGRPPLVDESANESLRQFQWGKHAPKQIHRDFSDRAAFSYGGVIHQDIDGPIQRVLDVVGMQEIKFFNSKSLQAKRLDLPAECSRLRPDLYTRDHIMTRLCQPDRG